MSFFRILAALVLSATLAVPAFAQDAKPVENKEFGVVISPPQKWDVTQPNDKAVANFKHRGSQSQIEVVGTKLMTADVAEVFFKTFHKTLKESNFEEKESKEVTLGELKGTLSNYKFSHSGVNLEVSVFQFLRENTAWLVVGYVQEVDKDKYAADFNYVVENIKFDK